jgi:hypothetical protein
MAKRSKHKRPAWFGHHTPIGDALSKQARTYARNVLMHVDVTDFFNSVDKLIESQKVPQCIRKAVRYECKQLAKEERRSK